MCVYIYLLLQTTWLFSLNFRIVSIRSVKERGRVPFPLCSLYLIAGYVLKIIQVSDNDESHGAGTTGIDRRNCRRDESSDVS